MSRVRSISRKGWIRTSQGSLMEKVRFTLLSNDIRLLGWVGSSCRSSTSVRTCHGLRSCTSSGIVSAADGSGRTIAVHGTPHWCTSCAGGMTW